MKNKTLFSFIVGIFIVLAMTSFVSSEEVNYSYSYNYDGIQVTFLKYEPYPVNPGEYFDVWIKANLGSSARYAKFEFVESFPFSIDSNEDPVRVYDEFSGDIVFHYKIRVSDDAVEGINDLKLNMGASKYEDISSVYNFEINIADAQTDFDLVIQDSTSSEVSLAIANIGKTTANSMIVRIPEQESFKVTGTNGQMVGNLDSGDYTIVSFSISQIGRSENPLVVQIDYTDSIGERRSVTKEIDFSSGNLISANFSEGEMPEGFEMGNFPGRGNSLGQQKKAKWPYFLAGFLILIFVCFIVYGKYKKQIKSFLKKENKKISKEIEIPEWMIKEKEKVKGKR